MKTTANLPVTDAPVGFGETLAYGAGNFAEMLVFSPATTFMVYFFTDVAGIAAATVGTIMLVSRVFDFLNPGVGVLVDRTHSRHGKARPWLLWMAVPFGLSAILLFTVPSFRRMGNVFYAFVTYNLALTLIYSLIDVPFGALLPLITRDQRKRTALSLSRMILGQFGGLVSFAITLPLVAAFGGAASGWQHAFILFGVTATVLLVVCFFFTKERVTAESTHKSHVPVAAGAGSLLRNKYWLLLIGLAGMSFIVMGLFGAGPYYCRYFLGSVDRYSPLMTVYQGVLVLGMLAASPMIKRFGKRNSALLGLGVAATGQLLMLLSPSSFPLIVAGTVIKALGFSPLIGTLFAMVADSIEYGEWRFNVRAEGLAFGTVALAAKISVGLGNVMVGWILGFTGYESGAISQSSSVLFGIKVMFIHMPLAGFLAAGVCMWFYKLDQQYPTIAAELKTRLESAV
jgi:glycoside/pentoside/hexuronide:cation symporter, GPH family